MAKMEMKEMKNKKKNAAHEKGESNAFEKMEDKKKKKPAKKAAAKKK